jgi:hypothetical protein
VGVAHGHGDGRVPEQRLDGWDRSAGRCHLRGEGMAQGVPADRPDVVLDVWELKPGHDKFQFMERMVTDSSINHVLIVCNPAYAQKADGRKGGVGDETQIITPEVYKKTKSSKFVPVLAALDDNGQPILPAFLGSRIYIDLSSEQVYYEGYEHLLRLIHGAPAFEKPALGTKPEFLTQETTATPPTSPLLRKALHSIENEKRAAAIDARTFLTELCRAIAALRVTPQSGVPIDDLVIESIRRGKQYRDEFITLLEALCKFATPELTEKLLVDFLENLLREREHAGPGSWQEAEFDGIRFLSMEIFLYAVTVLLVREQFEVVKGVLGEAYLHEKSGGTRKSDYSAFYAQLESVEVFRKQRLRLDRTSLVADLLKERADQKEYPFDKLQLTDLLLYVRVHLSKGRWWYPRSLVFVSHFPGPFDVFLAPESKRRFSLLAAMLDVTDVADLRSKLESAFPKGPTATLQFGNGWPISIRPLLNMSEPGER